MYRFCDKVWAFVLNVVEFTEMIELIKVDKVTIVAYDGKNTGFNTTEWIEKKWLANTFSVIKHHFLTWSTEDT